MIILKHAIRRNSKLDLGMPGPATTMALVALTFLSLLSLPAGAQSLPSNAVGHPAFRSNLPTGSIGAMQVARGVAPAGYVQPVRISVPEGARVEVAGGGSISPTQPHQLLAGLIVGQPYRFKVSGIPRHMGQVIYPSVELIGRLHPPDTEKHRFPVPIEIDQEDLELAIGGSMIIRVVYLENPELASPAAQKFGQPVEDVLAAEDPLQIADQLGRPMAIVRLGSRVPLDGDGDTDFLFGSPPVEWMTEPSPRLEPEAGQLPPVIDSKSRAGRPMGLPDSRYSADPATVPNRVESRLGPAVSPPIEGDDARPTPNTLRTDVLENSGANDPFLDDVFPE